MTSKEKEEFKYFKDRTIEDLSNYHYYIYNHISNNSRISYQMQKIKKYQFTFHKIILDLLKQKYKNILFYFY